MSAITLPNYSDNNLQFLEEIFGKSKAINTQSSDQATQFTLSYILFNFSEILNTWESKLLQIKEMCTSLLHQIKTNEQKLKGADLSDVMKDTNSGIKHLLYCQTLTQKKYVRLLAIWHPRKLAKVERLADESVDLLYDILRIARKATKKTTLGHTSKEAEQMVDASANTLNALYGQKC